MKDKKNSLRYWRYKNPITGKQSIDKTDEWNDMDDFDNQKDGMDDDFLVFRPEEIIRTVPCPYKFDEPEIAKKLSKAIKKLKLSFEVNFEISLSHKDSIPQEKHQHTFIIEAGDKNKYPPNTDFSDIGFDPVSIFCGFNYNLSPKIRISPISKEISEDKNTLKLIKRVGNDAVKNNEELQKLGEKEKNELKLKNHLTLLDKIGNYLQQHLTHEIKRTVERLEFESHLLNDRADEREFGIAYILETEEREIRKRLPTRKGRVPIKQRSDFKKLQQNFIKECVEKLGELEHKKARLNKNQLAKKMFRGDNPLLLLNRKLKDFDLTFDEILQKYIEQKSS